MKLRPDWFLWKEAFWDGWRSYRAILFFYLKNSFITTTYFIYSKVGMRNWFPDVKNTDKFKDKLRSVNATKYFVELWTGVEFSLAVLPDLYICPWRASSRAKRPHWCVSVSDLWLLFTDEYWSYAFAAPPVDTDPDLTFCAGNCWSPWVCQYRFQNKSRWRLSLVSLIRQGCSNRDRREQGAFFCNSIAKNQDLFLILWKSKNQIHFIPREKHEELYPCLGAAGRSNIGARLPVDSVHVEHGKGSWTW